jgi:hypothetical protein
MNINVDVQTQQVHSVTDTSQARVHAKNGTQCLCASLVVCRVRVVRQVKDLQQQLATKDQQMSTMQAKIKGMLRASSVVCRVSCVVCRVSCVVCRVSCVVCSFGELGDTRW